MPYASEDSMEQTYRMGRSRVQQDMRIDEKPPYGPGVYLFLGAGDRIMYAGMAHGLEAVLYRYQHLAGRKAMRDRARGSRIHGVVWLECGTRWSPPSLERLLIERYAPPWNTQHSTGWHNEETAVVLDAAEISWIEESARELDGVVIRLRDNGPMRD